MVEMVGLPEASDDVSAGEGEQQVQQVEEDDARRGDDGAVDNCGHLETVETSHPHQPDQAQLGIALVKDIA